ncbi:MAG: hypothetical protein ABIV50_07485, partial [Opitutus sp.]
MHPSPSPTSPLVAAYARPVAGSFAQRSVLGAFRKMRRGHLRIELPDGTAQDFGDASTVVDLPTGLVTTASIRVLRPEFFAKCFWSGDIGLAESYLDGDWETPHLSSLIAWFILNVENAPTLSGSQRAQSWA